MENAPSRLIIGLIAGVLIALAAQVSAQNSGGVADPRAQSVGIDPGCVSRTLVSAGGTAPKNPQALAIRWIGHSNFELAYNGQVILLDARVQA